MKRKYKGMIFLFMFVSIFIMTSCGADTSVMQKEGYTNGYISIGDTTLCYTAPDSQKNILNYDTMETGIICNKPNCSHSDTSCVSFALGEYMPIFIENKAYFWIDDPESMEPNEEGIPDLKLGATLYSYDVFANETEKILHVDDVSVSLCYGMALHQGTLYFVGNYKGRTYNENGIMLSKGNSGGRMGLFSVDLQKQEVHSFGDIYDLDALSAQYSGVKSSIEAYMKGIYDNKIYFEVSYIEDDTDMENLKYNSYVTYYNLETNEFAPQPEDLSNIDYVEIAFVSENYLVLVNDEHIFTIYQQGSDTSIEIEDENTNMYSEVFVDNDKLFFGDKIYDLKTGAYTINEKLKDSVIIAKYQGSYIMKLPANETFEKIAKDELV